MTSLVDSSRLVRRLAALFSAITVTSAAFAIPSNAAARTTKPKKPTAKVKWRTCDDPIFQCTEVQVPIDRANPAGGKLTLSLVKRPLPSGTKKIGTLITGLGFPGLSGVNSMKADVRTKVLAASWANYDVIAFEHRGTGTSSPMGCATKPTDLGFDSFVDPFGERQVEILRVWRQNCVDRNPALARNIGVSASVEDLEAIRVAIGETKLTFESWNHDATIAAAYAARYPAKTRGLVLFDPYPMVDQDNYILDLAAEAEKNVNRFLDTCQASPNCAFFSTGKPYERFDRLVEKIDEEPVPVSGDPEDGAVTAADVIAMVNAARNDESTWPAVAGALAGLENGDAKASLSLIPEDATAYISPLSTNGGSFWAIACSDGLYPGGAQFDQVAAQLIRVAPGTFYLYVPLFAGCRDWPVPSSRLPSAAFRSAVPTVIFSGRSGDYPAKWSANASTLIGGSSLGTWAGGDEASSSCIERTLTAFLNQLAMPPRTFDC